MTCIMDQHHHRNTRVCLALLCGLPGAGKTSLAISLTEKGHSSTHRSSLSHTGMGGDPVTMVLHLCYDDIIPRQLEGSASEEDSDITEKSSQSSLVSPWKAYREEIIHCMDWILEKLVSCRTSSVATVFREGLLENLQLSQIGRTVWRKMMELFRDQLGAILSRQPDQPSTSPSQDRKKQSTSSVIILIDDNMYYRSMRYKYHQLARKYCNGLCQLYLRCSTDVAIARNRERCHGIAEETIIRMAEKMEAPDAQAASWEKHCVHIDTEQINDENSMSAVWNLITDALVDPVLPLEEENEEEKEASRAVCASSIIHQADQSLRRCVANGMAAAKDEGALTKAELRTLASKLNAVRNDILQGVRDGKVILPPSLVTVESHHPDSRTATCSDVDIFIQNLFEKGQGGT